MVSNTNITICEWSIVTKCSLEVHYDQMRKKISSSYINQICLHHRIKKKNDFLCNVLLCLTICSVLVITVILFILKLKEYLL